MPRIAKAKVVKEKMIHGEDTKNKVLRNWHFVINNYTDACIAKITESVEDGTIRGVIYGKEVSKGGYPIIGDDGVPLVDEKGVEMLTKPTPHLQGYAEFRRGMRTGGACKALGGHACMFIAGGSREQNIKYCSKGEADWDHTPGADNSGVVPVNPQVTTLGKWEGGGQGARTDLIDLMERIEKGEEVIDTMKAMPEVYSRHMRFAESFRSNIEKRATKAFRKVTTSVFWGDAGTGKTRKAVELAEAAGKRYFFVNSDFGSFPFQGYDGEEVIIFDDFYGSHVKYDFLLRLLDGYQVQLNVKGGSRYSAWDTVYMTSNVEPSMFYVNKGLTDALARRIHVTEHFAKKCSEDFCSEVAGVILDPATTHTKEDLEECENYLSCLDILKDDPKPIEKIEIIEEICEEIPQITEKKFIIKEEIHEEIAYYADNSSEDNIAGGDEIDITEFMEDK